MKIRAIPPIGTDVDTDFSLVELKRTVQNHAFVWGMYTDTPHCKKHGAMNKVSVFNESNGGYWRCSVTSETRCRAGCIQD